MIASSALFRDGQVDVAFARALADAMGAERVIAAVDSRGGFVAIHGWKTILPVTAVGYILTALAGKYLLAEQISDARWWGTLLIFAGMVVVGSTAPRTEA